MGWWHTIMSRNGRPKDVSDLGEMGFLPRGAFQRELQRQRAKCDRSGGGFVLLVFTDPASPAANGSSGFARLAAVIAGRIRLSDVAGEFEAHSKIGVILPDTTTDGAELFIEAVEGLLRRELNGRWRPDSKLQCEVSMYPQARPVVALAAREKAATGKY